MNVLDNIFSDSFTLHTVKNPITLTRDNCKLLNTKKDTYYIYTYDPYPYLAKLREIGVSQDYLSRFDHTIRHNCCNVISIMLYIPDCTTIDRLTSYLNSINRTVKNTLRNLENWVVRLYLDETVYQCINNAIEYIQSNLSQDPENREILLKRQCLEYFESIINSPNVELYTFICEDIVSLDKTRTYRYLVLIDPEVNISVIREADGYINNLECHNLKMFEKSDKLFYIPPIGILPNLIHETQPKRVFHSYSIWLQIYKNILARDFFSTHQNIYELLAGMFSFKLKLIPDFYYETVARLNREIDMFKDVSEQQSYISIANKYAPEDNSYPLSNMPIGMIQRMTIIMSQSLRGLLTNGGHYPRIIGFFEQGFDEILLLDIFKELISFEFPLPTEESQWQFSLNMESIERIKSLFLSYDSIRTYTFNSRPLTPLTDIIENLKTNNIIPTDTQITIPTGYMQDVDINAFIDGVILRYIIADHPFNINFSPINTSKSVLQALNLYYSRSYEPFYNYTERTESEAAMKKYLKYKSKYLKLKNKLF